MRIASIKGRCLVAGIALLLLLPACNQGVDTTPSAAAPETAVGTSAQGVPVDDRTPAISASVPATAENSAVPDRRDTASEHLQASTASLAAAEASQLQNASQPTVADGVSAAPLLSDIVSVYTRSPLGHTYVGGEADFVLPRDYVPDYYLEVKKGLALFDGLEPIDGQYRIIDHEFLIWTKDGVRHTYGISQEKYWIADGKAYLLPQERAWEIGLFQTYLLNTAGTVFVDAYPQWLVWMTPGKVQDVIFHSPTHGPLKIAPALTDYAAMLAVKAVAATGDSTYEPGSVDFSGSDVFHLEIRFTTGVVYKTYVKNVGYQADYYVESSDMPYGCKYRLKMTAVDGPAHYMIEDYEYIANAKAMKDVENPTT